MVAVYALGILAVSPLLNLIAHALTSIMPQTVKLVRTQRRSVMIPYATALTLAAQIIPTTKLGATYSIILWGLGIHAQSFVDALAVFVARWLEPI